MLALVFGFLAAQLVALLSLAPTATATSQGTTTAQPKRRRRGRTQLDPTTAHQRDGTTHGQSDGITSHDTHPTTAHRRTGRTRGTPHGQGHTRTSTHCQHDGTDDAIRRILSGAGKTDNIGSDTIRGPATPVLAAA